MKNKITDFVYVILYFIPIIILILFIIFEIYLWSTYGNKPIDEIPLWVLWFLWGK